jgi:hypothetical protein
LADIHLLCYPDGLHSVERTCLNYFAALRLIIISIRPVKSGRLRWIGHVAQMGEIMTAYEILTGKPLIKRSLLIPRRIWEDDIKVDIMEMCCEDGRWMFCRLRIVSSDRHF